MVKASVLSSYFNNNTAQVNKNTCTLSGGTITSTAIADIYLVTMTSDATLTMSWNVGSYSGITMNMLNTLEAYSFSN